MSGKTKNEADAECIEVDGIPADFMIEGVIAYTVKNGKLVKG
jgi:hypothetical protein